jgi:hypothetical protein
MVSTAFCARCGERPRNPRDLTLLGLARLAFHSFSDLDGRVLRSLRCLVARPGALSVAYERGQRVATIGPFQLFFLANVVFFGLETLTGVKIFSSTLASHLSQQNWSELAGRLVARRLEVLDTSLADFAPLFDRAAVLHAKSLIVLMVVPFALLLPLFFRRSAKPFGAHAVFALHHYAFLLLLFCFSMGFASVSELLGGRGLDSNGMDTALSLLNLGACAAYLTLATRAFYGARGVLQAVQVAGLTLAVAAIVLGYRFTVFWISLYGV